MRWRKRIGLSVFLVALILAIAYGLMPGPIPVDIAKVTRGPLRVTIEEEGKTRVMDRFVISAPVAGFARRIRLDVGDFVTQGQTLVDLEPQRSKVLDPRSRAEAKARIAAARAALGEAQEKAHAAKADADYAAAELGRIKQLYKAGYVSQDRMDQTDTEARRTRANLRSAKFASEVARFELQAARTALQYSAAEETLNHARMIAIRSPVNGRVLNIHHQSERAVNEGQALIEIGDPRALEVEVDVLSADAVRIGSGTRVVFERWGGDVPLQGKVRIVEPAGFTKISALGVEEQRVLVIVDITSTPDIWEQLGNGYRVEASFILWEGKDILQIPTSALFRYGDDWAVFVFENRRAMRRPVQVGYRSSLTAEIVSGLTHGEAVITYPDDSIEDGICVRLR